MIIYNKYSKIFLFLILFIVILMFDCKTLTSVDAKTTTGSVKGVVTNYNTGEPVEGAYVTVSDSYTNSYSDGSYRIENVSEGDFLSIYATKEGYEDYSDSVSVKAGSTTTKDIELEPSE
jgi:hypothetical protein